MHCLECLCVLVYLGSSRLICQGGGGYWKFKGVEVFFDHPGGLKFFFDFQGRGLKFFFMLLTKFSGPPPDILNDRFLIRTWNTESRPPTPVLTYVNINLWHEMQIMNKTMAYKKKTEIPTRCMISYTTHMAIQKQLITLDSLITFMQHDMPRVVPSHGKECVSLSGIRHTCIHTWR